MYYVKNKSFESLSTNLAWLFGDNSWVQLGIRVIEF